MKGNRLLYSLASSATSGSKVTRPPFNTFPISTDEGIFDPCDSDSARTSEGAEPILEETAPKKWSQKEQYALAGELDRIRTEGCAPTKRALSLLFEALKSRSQLKTSLSDCNVTLFNFHSTKFAERLLEHNVESVVLVENAHCYANAAKDFARAHRKQFRAVCALRADISSLLGLGRKKLTRLPTQLLPEKAILNPLTLTTKQAADESGGRFERSPVLISTLPTSTQQATVIQALQNNLLLHHAGLDGDTIYQYGATQLLTFVDMSTLCHLLCGVEGSLSFMAHSHRRNSALLNKLFRVRLLRPSPFPASSFHPRIPIPFNKTIPHEKKLRELSFKPGHFYGISIEPQTEVRLDGKAVDATDAEGNGIERSCLPSFSFWMQLVGRQPQSKRTATVISNLCPESASLASVQADFQMRIGDQPNEVLERLFLIVGDELRHTDAYKKYVSSLRVKREVA